MTQRSLAQPARILVLLGMAISAGGCPTDPDPPTTYLLVSKSEVQPMSPDSGVLLNIQASGGTRLQLRVSGGKMVRSVDGTVQEAMCVSVSQTFPLLVKPDDAEALLFADLLAADVPSGVDGAGPQPCSGTLLQSVIFPVSLSTNDMAGTSSGATTGASTSVATSTGETSSGATTTTGGGGSGGGA